MQTSPRLRLPRLVVLGTDSRLARGYLAVFALSIPVVLLFPESPFAMAPILLTAPLSLFAMVLPFGPGTEGGGAAEALATGFWGGWVLLSALVNAAALGALTRRPDAAPAVRRHPGKLRALLAPAFDNWLARAYCAVVAVALGFFLYAVLLSPDPGFAGIWPLITAAPFSFLAVPLSLPAEHSGIPGLGTLVFTVAVGLAGLVDAVLIGRLAHRLRGEGR
ncbi:SCO4225 family membrane protein [Streptomyces nigra]|uniref:SCO4225 family membrane protein n=1 Tax=Streptomyces nigra TaxID=1827580 RepID=UPI00368F1D05